MILKAFPIEVLNGCDCCDFEIDHLSQHQTLLNQ